MNKKGFLLYELFIAFTFIIIIMLVMLQTTINLKNQQKDMMVNNQVNQATRSVYAGAGSDFKNYKVASINNISYNEILTGSRTFEISYYNPSNLSSFIKKNLIFNADTHTITYDGTKMDLAGIKSELTNVYIKYNEINGRKTYKIYFVFADESYNFNISCLGGSAALKYKTTGTASGYLLNYYNWVENVVRDSDGGLHIAYLDTNNLTAYYINSTNNGKTWSTPQIMYQGVTGVAYQPQLLIDSNDRIHFLMSNSEPDYLHFFHRYKDKGGSWSTLTKVGTTDSDEIASNTAHTIDANNVIHLLYDRSHYRGFGYKSWNGSWSTGSGIDQALSNDMNSFKTLLTNGTQYAFFSNFTTQRFGMFKKVTTSGVKTIPITGTSYPVTVHDEIVDSEGNIWIFFTRTDINPFTTHYIKYNVVTDTFGPVTFLDSGSSHVAYPSATVDSKGNIYVLYSIYDLDVWQIVYKVYNKSTQTWSARENITTPNDGHAVYPKVRYQDYNMVDKNIIDFSYRQNDIGSTTTYNLYYGRLET